MRCNDMQESTCANGVLPPPLLHAAAAVSAAAGVAGPFQLGETP